MPNRYVREDAIESDSVNALTWRGEVFFRRLINRADDFGRYSAEPKILRPKIFPLQLEKVGEMDVASLLSECEAVGLLFVYIGADGKRYLVLNKWEKGRAEKSKFPEPPQEVCERMKTFVYSRIQPQTIPPTPIPTPTLTPTPPPSAGDAPAQREAGSPTAKEVTDYCSVGLGIPADYCEHYHAQKTIQNGWVKNGLLIQWKLDIPRWWAKDRATWAQRRNPQAGKPEHQSVWAMQKQLDAVLVEMKKIEKRGHEDPVSGLVIKAEDRAGYKLLKKRRDELNASIAKGGQ